MTATGVYGDVSSGFEPIRDTFTEHLGEVGQGGAAFAGVINGKLVVDLWAGRAGSEEWSREKRVVWHAATNGFCAIVIARLADLGVIDVHAPVAKYWPEFAAGGKSDITVAQILSHQSGIFTVPGFGDFMKPTGEGWDKTDEILRRLASATPMWRPGTAHGYGGFTFVWMLGEIVRRVTGMSLGTVLREEIVKPTKLELDLGTPLERQTTLAIPTAANDPLPDAILQQLKDPLSVVSQSFLGAKGDDYHTTSVVLDTNPNLLALELPYNVTGTARAAAILYGALADGGKCGDLQIVSPETISSFARETSRGMDLVAGRESRFGLGFMLALPPDGYHPWGPHSETFGHTGLGIQFSLADPISHLGVAFTRSHYSWRSLLGKQLLDVLYDCIAKQ
jgi:CubicO group peptidase (beta-lactamase class C family)